MPGAEDPRWVVCVGREDGERLRAAARVLGLASRRGDGVATFMREAAVRAAREVLGGGPPAAEGGTGVRSSAADATVPVAGAGGSSRAGGVAVPPAAAPSLPATRANAKLVVGVGAARAVPVALAMLEAGRVALADDGAVVVDGKRV